MADIQQKTDEFEWSHPDETRRRARLEKAVSLVPLLSEREFQIFHALRTGAPNEEIAEWLHISPHTVRFHLRSLARKLGGLRRVEICLVSLAAESPCAPLSHRADGDNVAATTVGITP